MIKSGKYRHFKGKMYEVTGSAIHTETLEPMVIYKALYASDFPEGTLWVRPLSMFTEYVEADGKKVLRFEPV